MKAEIEIKISRNAEGEYVAEAAGGWSIPSICFKPEIEQSEEDSAILTIEISEKALSTAVKTVSTSQRLTSTTTTTISKLPDGRYEIGPPRRG